MLTYLKTTNRHFEGGSALLTVESIRLHDGALDISARNGRGEYVSFEMPEGCCIALGSCIEVTIKQC